MYSVDSRYELNCVQELMVSGPPDAGCLTDTAAFCTWGPSGMWREKNVRLIKDENDEYNLRYESAPQCHWMALACSNEEHCPAVGHIAVGYLLGSICFAPFLALGMCLKQVALCADPEANEYHQRAVRHLNEMGDMSWVDRSLREWNFMPLGNGSSQRLAYIEQLKTQITSETRDLEFKESFLVNVEYDIKANESKSMEPFVVRNLTYTPDGDDYLIFNAKERTSTSRNQLINNISKLKKNREMLNGLITQTNQKKEQYQQASQDFLRDARNLMAGESGPRIKLNKFSNTGVEYV